MTFKELFCELADSDVEFEVIDDIDELLDRLKKIADEKEVEEEEEDIDEDIEEDEELIALREEAISARKDLAEEFGEKKASQVVDFASHYAMLESLLHDSLPLDQSMVDEYNALCRKVYPEKCKTVKLALTYAALRKMCELGVESLG